jgi:hypothetical protein
MKIFIYILIFIAIGLMIYNATMLDFDNLFEGDSSIAAISILAAACAIVLLLILKTSITIKKKSK